MLTNPLAPSPQGRVLQGGPGLLVSGALLVVQRVTRAHGGNYSCEASNDGGTTVSHPLTLDVKCEYICYSVMIELTITVDYIRGGGGTNISRPLTRGTVLPST